MNQHEARAGDLPGGIGRGTGMTIKSFKAALDQAMRDRGWQGEKWRSHPERRGSEVGRRKERGGEDWNG